MLWVAFKVAIAVVLPVFVFRGGSKLMSRCSGRKYVQKVLKGAADCDDQTPLNMRLRYSVNSVHRHWGAFARDPDALNSERCFLKLDLAFPVFYGGALAISLWLLWTMLGRWFNPAWIFIPVVITVVADWIENSVQLTQLSRYVRGGFQEAALQPGAIRVASAATFLKLLFFSVSALLNASMIIGFLSQFIDRRIPS